VRFPCVVTQPPRPVAANAAKVNPNFFKNI
jgi:hypothetical protein